MVCRLLQQYLNRIYDIMEKENRVFTYEELRARLDEVANFALYAIELWIFDYVNSGHKTPKDREEI